MNTNLLAIIVAFYLSKFNKEGLNNLGFKNDADAFETTANALGVKKNYVKFRRDEFDPIHPWRKGWQRPMDSRIIKSIEALQDIEEPDLRDIVMKILHDNNYRYSDEVKKITSLFSEEKSEKVAIGKFILRAPTGRAAEDFFIKYFSESKKPIEGNLIDCRDLGVGYDFRIEAHDEIFFVEVKGLSDFSGGVLFTSKEWIVAQNEGDNFFLCVISNISEIPEVLFIQNPAKKLKPKKNIYTTIQISWSVTEKQLTLLND